MSERTYLFLMNAEQAEAFARLVEAANAGDGGAACRLGDMCREGVGGLRYSPKQTFRWYSRSALAGDAGGQNNLGACYEHGLGCAQSYPKAVKWYRRSHTQGLGIASMNLGYCYLRGHGVPADKDEALRLFRLAVEQGEDRAADELDRRADEPEGARSPQHSAADTQRAPLHSASCCAKDQPSNPHAGVRRGASHPCVLALGVPRRDSPQANLRKPGADRERLDAGTQPQPACADVRGPETK